MSLKTLPPELVSMISDMACKVRTNGKTSSNIRIIIRTQLLPSSCQKEAVQWVQSCLEHRRLEYVKQDVDNYPWYVVSNVAKEQEGPVVDANGNTSYPEIVVAIRIGWNEHVFVKHESDEEELIVLDENPPCPSMEVDADVFKEIIKEVPPPPFITAVGVSAVSDEFMMALWEEIISTNPETLDGRGEGHMLHRMWVRRGQPPGWVDMREQSCMFGWKGYNPDAEE